MFQLLAFIFAGVAVALVTAFFVTGSDAKLLWVALLHSFVAMLCAVLDQWQQMRRK